MTYSAKVRELVSELPNSGALPTATHVFEADNPICGDLLKLYLEVRQGRIRQVTYQAQGCPAALASAAALSLVCRDCSLDECQQLQPEDLVDFLGGLPSHKLHGAELAVDALRGALS